MPNPLKQLNDFGQSPWLDFVSRDLLRSGQLSKMIADDGLKGVTSNPSIFEKAIGHGDDYDEMIREAEATGDLDPGALFEGLAVHEIRDGADAMRRVYQQTHARDGYISLEVSPYLAMDTAGTIEEARRIWREVDRPNLMVKVPGTPAGIPAIKTLIGEGININVTLFSRPRCMPRLPRPTSPVSKTLSRRAAIRITSPASPASSSAASTRWSTIFSTRRSPPAATRSSRS